MREIERKKAAVTLDDVQILRKNLFELTDLAKSTDDLVRLEIAPKVELNKTNIEDINSDRC